jgi:hypothetical protein
LFDGLMSANDAQQANRKEQDMTQQAVAQLFAVEPSPETGRGVREQIESTAQAMAAADEASLREAIDSVSWERRGFLRRLSARPTTR